MAVHNRSQHRAVRHRDPAPPARRADGPRTHAQPPPPVISARDRFDATTQSPQLRRVQQDVGRQLDPTRTDATLTPRDVSRVHDLLGRLSPADYRRELDSMSRNGQLGRYLGAMTPHQQSAFLQQAASHGYLRMEGGRPCEGTANPPRVPALYQNDSAMPPEVQEAVSSTNQQLATSYARDVDQYAQRYSQQVEATSDVPGLRSLGAPVQPAPMTEPGTGQQLAQPSIEQALQAILAKVLELLERAQAPLQGAGSTPQAAGAAGAPVENPPAQADSSAQATMAMFACAFIGMTPDQLQQSFDPQSFFRPPPELGGGTAWNQLDRTRQQSLNQNGWTGQEWAAAR